MSKIGFVFPGQGAQHIGMGKEIYEKYNEAKNIFNKADSMLGYSITNICFYGSDEELNKTSNVQPAMLTTSIAILEILKKYNIKPHFTAGLSLGEYSALVCSGAISFEEAVVLVKKRGEFMSKYVEPGNYGMCAIIGLEETEVKNICNELSTFRIYNSCKL